MSRFPNPIVIAILAAEFYARANLEASQPSLTVIVYDYTGVERPLLDRAQREAARILGNLGYPLTWEYCSATHERAPTGRSCEEPAGPTALVLQLLPENASRRNTSQGAMGFALPPEQGAFGLYCGVFYDRVQQLSRGPLAEAIVLGHAMAHEIGHLLLGIDGHTQRGLMSALWGPRELALAAQGKLLFGDADQRKMQANVLERIRLVGSSK